MTNYDQRTITNAIGALEANRVIFGISLEARKDAPINSVFFREKNQLRILLKAGEVAFQYLKKNDPRPAARLFLGLSKRTKKDPLGNLMTNSVKEDFKILSQQLTGLHLRQIMS